MKNKLKTIFTPFVIVSAILFLLCLILYLISGISYSLADLVNSTASHWVRRCFAAFGDLFSFSLFELVIILLPLALIIVIRKAVLAFKTAEGRTRFISKLAAFVLLIYGGHLLTIGVAHNSTPLATKMGMPSVEVNGENLATTLEILTEEINSLADALPRNDDGVFTTDLTFDEISGKVTSSYNALAEIYDLIPGFDSRAKSVANGWAMCYLGISGIYTYPTGEANVNSYYPSYVTIFTAAHEMCHQRGVLRENEANFLAFLITMTSDHPHLRYSGAMEVYSYVASALYRTDKDAYFELYDKLSPLARADFREANRISDLYDDTIIEKISEKINDLYLKSNGSDGVVSYGYVVRLVVAYYNREK